MAAQICETCKKKGNRCYCAPNSTCKGYEKRKITQFEKIKLMDVEDMSKFFATNKYPDFPHSPCDICKYNEGLFCDKFDGCTNEYKAYVYRMWLESEVEE